MPDRAGEPRPGAALLRAFALLLLPLLAACAEPRPFAPEVEVTRALYPNGGDTKLTLFTVVNNRTGAGDHSALLISGAHRILYDPAGSWFHTSAPQRNDVHYGISTRLEQIYLGYHARATHHVVVQTIPVTPETAALAMRLAEEARPAPAGACAIRTGGILRRLPGLEGLPGSPFPRRLMNGVAELPGVTTRRVDVEDLSPDVLPRGPEALAAQAG